MNHLIIIATLYIINIANNKINEKINYKSKIFSLLLKNLLLPLYKCLNIKPMKDCHDSLNIFFFLKF